MGCLSFRSRENLSSPSLTSTTRHPLSILLPLQFHTSFLSLFASIHVLQLHFFNPNSNTLKRFNLFVGSQKLTPFCSNFSVLWFLVMKNQFLATWVSPKTKVIVYLIVFFCILWCLEQVENFTVSMKFLGFACWTIENPILVYLFSFYHPKLKSSVPILEHILFGFYLISIYVCGFLFAD